MKTFAIIILLFMALFSGCVAEKRPEGNLSAPVPQITVTANVPENARDVVELARKNLSTMLQIPETDIRVLDVIPVDWPDASLGYPVPGQVYAEVRTSGYLIFLLAGGEEYEYHSSGMIIAPPPGPLIKPEFNKIPPNRTEQSGNIAELAKKDLAARLKIPESSVKVLQVTPTEWPDASLGYPEPEMVYSQVITPGFILFLSAENKVYEYHASNDRVVAPPGFK